MKNTSLKTSTIRLLSGAETSDEATPVIASTRLLSGAETTYTSLRHCDDEERGRSNPAIELASTTKLIQKNSTILDWLAAPNLSGFTTLARTHRTNENASLRGTKQSRGTANILDWFTAFAMTKTLRWLAMAVICLFATASLSAQEKKVYIHKDGAAVFETAISGIDSIIFYDPASEPLSIKTHPQSVNASVISELVLFKVEAQGGTPGYTYQWQYSTDSGISWTNITGMWSATTDELNISATTATNGRQYRCIVTDSATPRASVTSNAATLTVPIPTIEILTQPSDVTVTQGSITGSLTISATVRNGITPTPTYMWYKSDIQGNSPGAVLSTSASFTIPTNLTAAESPYYYICRIVTPGASSVYSRVVTVTVVEPYTPPPGTAENPFQVATVADLQKVASGTDGWTEYAHYLQTANINLSSINNWTSIDIAYGFPGTYDGGGYTISNMRIDQPYATEQGLFREVREGGIVKNLALVNVNIRAAATVGGITGINRGTIQNCYVTGTIYATGWTSELEYLVGGIAGCNFSSGIIENCYTTCDVTGETTVMSDMGGITGYLGTSATVRNCYTTGRVHGKEDIGGIAGSMANQSRVLNCVALNSVIIVREGGTSRIGRIVGINISTPNGLSNNYARAAGMRFANNNGSTDINAVPDASGEDGENVSAANYNGENSGTWWRSSSGVNFNTTYWSFANGRLPHLKTTTGGTFSQTQNPTVQ